MDIRQLKYFIAVADRGSFTRASELLGLAQPSLGFQIRKLENELKVQLFVRTSRGVQLTESGRLLFERGKLILADFAALQQQLDDSAEEPHGPVALGLTPSLADRFVIPLIEEVRQRFPGIDLTITEELSQTLIEMIEIGHINLALAYDALLTPSKGLEVRVLAHDNIHLLASPKQAGSDVSPLDCKRLADYPLILPRKPHLLRQHAENVATQCGIELHIAYEMQSLPTILRLVEHGIGATLIAGGDTNRMVKEGRLVARSLVNPALQHDVSLVHSEARPLSRAEQAVADVLETLVITTYRSAAS
jgi:LysR family nitrogen assimilation transcriptional regulator